MNRRGLLGFVIVVLLGTYGYRAAIGVRAGWALDGGILTAARGDFEEAAPLLESAAVGANDVRALELAGEARLDQWQKETRRGGAVSADGTQLVQAGLDFLSCRCLAPTSRAAGKGMGEVYDAVEWIGREARAESRWSPHDNAWAGVGRPGRIAVGLFRQGIEIAPSWSALRDTLALTLWNYGLERETRLAVRDAAQVLPIYYRHPFHRIEVLPLWIHTEFAEASREVLGEVPLFPQTAHRIDLGKLERRIGENERAIQALQEALRAGGGELQRAEASFHLGLALIEVGRFAEGRIALETAVEHPVFRSSSLRALAGLATREGEDREALEYLRQLRRERPDDLLACLEFAETANRLEERPAALEALRWAKLQHPDDPRPYLALARTHLAVGALADAIAVTNELDEELGDDDGPVKTLRREIARASR